LKLSDVNKSVLVSYNKYTNIREMIKTLLAGGDDAFKNVNRDMGVF